MHSADSYRMTYKEYLMVLIGVCIGLIPGIGVYYYVVGHGGLGLVASDVQVEEVTRSLTYNTPKNAIVSIYSSKPIKIADGQCPNSYYRMFALVVRENNTFTLTQLCESKRDIETIWEGTASATRGIREGEAKEHEMLGLSIESADKANQKNEQNILFVREGKEMNIESSSITAIPINTSFTALIETKPEAPIIAEPSPETQVPNPTDFLE